MGLFIGQHGPQAAQGLRWNARPQQGDVTLQISADELLSPAQARCIAAGQISLRKASAQPQRTGGERLIRGQLRQYQRCQLNVGQAPGQTLGRLGKQFHAGRTQQQELATEGTSAPALVNDTPQHCKQARHALHLIQNDHLLCMRRKKCARVTQLRQIARCFQIQVDRCSGALPGQSQCALLHQLMRQRRLANLARPQNGYGRKLLHADIHFIRNLALVHGCNYSTQWKLCNAIAGSA